MNAYVTKMIIINYKYKYIFYYNSGFKVMEEEISALQNAITLLESNSFV